MTAISWGFGIEETTERLIQESTKARDYGCSYADVSPRMLRLPLPAIALAEIVAERLMPRKRRAKSVFADMICKIGLIQ